MFFPSIGMANNHTVYIFLEPHHSLGVSQDLYKLTRRLRLVAKPLSLDLRASTLVLELEWVYQSLGKPRESQWMGYNLLYRPQPPNLAVGKSRQNFHSSDSLTYAKMQASDHPVQVAVAPFCTSH